MGYEERLCTVDGWDGSNPICGVIDIAGGTAATSGTTATIAVTMAATSGTTGTMATTVGTTMAVPLFFVTILITV